MSSTPLENQTVPEEILHLADLDPVLKLGLEAFRLYTLAEDEEKLEFELKREPSAEINVCYLEMEYEDLRARVDLIDGYVSTLQARSLAGALVQLRLLSRVLGLAPDDDSSDYEKRQHEMTVSRLIHSIDHVLAAQVPPRLAEGILYANSHLDPWTSHEVRWAEVRRKQP